MPTLVVGTNTYQTRADATVYLDSSLRAALVWPAVDPDSQDRALITALTRG